MVCLKIYSKIFIFNIKIFLEQNVAFDIRDLGFLKVIASVLFLWAWYHQFKANIILGNLRKDKNGKDIFF